MKSQFSKFVLALGLFLLAITTTTVATKNQATFATNIFDAVSKEVTNKNIIISPASIRTCLAMTYMGAQGNTAKELSHVLKLGKNATKREVGVEFRHLLNSLQPEGEITVRMANRIFVNENYTIRYNFNRRVQMFFHSSVEKIDVNEKEETANKINKWIEEETEHKIQNVISPKDIDKDTAALLVNAFYFNAKWLHHFNTVLTSKKDFHLGENSTKTVDMMHDENLYFYAELKDLDAKALVLSYRATDIKMLLLLPNEVEGLAELKGKLKHKLLTELTTKLKWSNVRVSLPKFKFEFDISLVETLKKLGLRDLFTNAADLSRLFLNKNVAISKVIHKAFIEVNEYGTEAAAVTVGDVVRISATQVKDTYEFNVDHPFVFALLDESVVYFAGQVVDI